MGVGVRGGSKGDTEHSDLRQPGHGVVVSGDGKMCPQLTMYQGLFPGSLHRLMADGAPGARIILSSGA